MNQDINNKLHTILFPISPLASDRERLIEKIGETVWMESLEQILSFLPEDASGEVIEMLNNDDVDRALEVIESYNIDVDTVLTEVSRSVIDEVLSVIQ